MRKIIFLPLIVISILMYGVITGPEPSTDYTITQNVMLNKHIITHIVIHDIDSAENITPAFVDYIDASTYLSANDSDVVSTKVDGGNDSARLIVFGAFDDNNKGFAIETLATNKTTIFQRQFLPLDSAGKYVYPFIGFKAQGIDCSNAEADIWLEDIPKANSGN